MQSKVFNLHSNTYSFIYRLIDLSILFATLPIVRYFSDSFVEYEPLVGSLALAVIFLYIAESFGLYRAWRVGHLSEMVLSVWACFALSFLLFFILSCFITKFPHFSWDIVFYCFSISLLLSFTWRLMQDLFLKISYKAGLNIKRIAIIGATASCKHLLSEINRRNELGYRVHGVFDDRCPARIMNKWDVQVQGKIDDAIELAYSGKIDILFIALPLKAERRIGEILLRLGDTQVDVHYMPNILISTLVRSRCVNVGEIDTLSVFESPYLGAKEWIKRSEDIILSLLILTIIAVPLLVISIAIKLTSAGPILFKQRRYGLKGEEILVWKFRSMYVLEDNEKVTQASRNDPRVTPLGRFLRRTSLDEFPQFFNVLFGSMSIVGPRPHAVAHNEAYRLRVRYYMLRHKVKPGITGLAQINGWRGETDTLDKMENRVKCDLQYIKNWSVWLDIKIIYLTVLRGFTDKDAY